MIFFFKLNIFSRDIDTCCEAGISIPAYLLLPDFITGL